MMLRKITIRNRNMTQRQYSRWSEIFIVNRGHRRSPEKYCVHQDSFKCRVEHNTL